MKFLYSNPMPLRDVFSEFTALMHPGETQRVQHDPNWFYIGWDTRDGAHPVGLKHGWHDGKYWCVYGKLRPTVRDRVACVMTEGKIGAFKLKRWDTGLVLLVQDRAFIAHYGLAHLTDVEAAA